MEKKVIGYLEGTLRQLDATRALLVAAGVGYEVHISLATYYRLEGKREAAIEIYTHVREDALSLYGFATGEEKMAFEKLISISGIGPTLAQKILSGIDPPDLADAIARTDTRKLSSIPGVGKKTAERICLDARRDLTHVHRRRRPVRPRQPRLPPQRRRARPRQSAPGARLRSRILAGAQSRFAATDALTPQRSAGVLAG
jgi:Holliday junction DNA helicase RuvA